MARKPPESPQPTYFLDENTAGPTMLQRLRAAGLICEQHRDHFDEGAKDEDWIPVVAERGWWAVTRDGMIKKRSSEYAAHMRAGGVLLELRGQHLRLDDLASMLIAAHERLPGYIDKRKRPMIIHVHLGGALKLIDGGQRRGGVRR